MKRRRIRSRGRRREKRKRRKRRRRRRGRRWRPRRSRRRNQSYRFMGLKGHGEKQNNGEIKISSSQGLKRERLSGCEKLLSVVLWLTPARIHLWPVDCAPPGVSAGGSGAVRETEHATVKGAEWRRLHQAQAKVHLLWNYSKVLETPGVVACLLPPFVCNQCALWESDQCAPWERDQCESWFSYCWTQTGLHVVWRQENSRILLFLVPFN